MIKNRIKKKQKNKKHRDYLISLIGNLVRVIEQRRLERVLLEKLDRLVLGLRVDQILTMQIVEQITCFYDTLNNKKTNY